MERRCGSFGLSLPVSPPAILLFVLLPQRAALAVTESVASPSEMLWASCGPNR